MCKEKLKMAISHFKKICIHKKWVYHYCKMCDIPWRGIVHDLSKFHPVEFFESIKYYTGTSSPIVECKKQKGYSEAWMHHKYHNKHHREYWIDNLDKGGVALDMPYKYTVEMLCDYLGAARAYMGKNFSYMNEFKWFIDQLNRKPEDEEPYLFMHLHQKVFLYQCLSMLASNEYENIRKKLKDPKAILYNIGFNILNKVSLEYIYKNSKEFTEKDFMNLRNEIEVEKEWGGIFNE